MLQHLYSCEHLEYWCYDCAEVEQLYDIKCRRCLGHPLKRKRLMCMANSVFFPLGRTKYTTFQGTPLNEDGPPSYFSLTESHQQFELKSNEIHDIDSCEVMLPSIPEKTEMCQEDYIRRPSSTSTNYTNHTDPRSISSWKSAPHTYAPLVDKALINWEPSPPKPTRRSC